MYQFKFGVMTAEISEIFSPEREISKKFEQSFMNNYAILLCRLKSYVKFLQAKSITCSELKNISFVFSEDEIIEVFKKDLKRHIVYVAIQMVFEGKLNVEENIIDLLNSDYIKKWILGPRLLYSFHYVYGPQNYLIETNATILSELENEFLYQ